MIKRLNLNSTKKIILSFFMVILVGSILLTLPFSNHQPTMYINHLFTSTSAVCVTGLVPYATAGQYTIIGQIIIIILIQIGGLGFLTFYSIVINMFSNKMSYSLKLTMQEALNQGSTKAIVKYIKRVIKYTVFFESLGAFALSLQFIPQYGLAKGIYYSVFHSISAFCNAGFDVLGDSSLMNYATNPLVNIVICGLIICGGLGFVVWEEISARVRHKSKHKYSVHARLAIITTIVCLVVATVAVFFIEYNNVLADFNLFDKLMVSFFQSTTLRTAGFATVDYAILNNTTKLIMCLFMFVGGSPASTAGGVKTVTIAITALYIGSLLRGKETVTVFNKRIKDEIVKKSLAISVIFLLFIFGALIILSYTEKMAFLDIAFEIFSAICTVGLTCGVTTSLTVIGKIVIILLMFTGRVGPVSIIMIMGNNEKKGKDILYANEDVIIG